mmetsp:Transcript_3177/g.13278  ORF Transcript_3177/g.13278 Transcript_3177/m.13278 type:complete len:274 (-) Transcript_3177:328-1149(-)
MANRAKPRKVCVSSSPRADANRHAGSRWRSQRNAETCASKEAAFDAEYAALRNVSAVRVSASSSDVPPSTSTSASSHRTSSFASSHSGNRSRTLPRAPIARYAARRNAREWPCRLPNARVCGEHAPRTYPRRGSSTTVFSLSYGLDQESKSSAESNRGTSSAPRRETPSLGCFVGDAWSATPKRGARFCLKLFSTSANENDAATRFGASGSTVWSYRNMSRSALRISEVAPSACANTATMSSPSSPSTWYTLAPAARKASARNVSALSGMSRA